ncbi:chloramphenicol phosphotransferase CPT family protein [Estrella lausannensis]|uniref:Chloramphenicol phosphotransferase family protein n=1 Tax=Estrella lausannensis TaxID=483423 RepID=A0A0H5DNI9_9BACT|nr:AAA family ATPase [Estrella lausannensis]CRX37906.1 Chloramphenicol phosphotransferase family protein [Estrella lausannensis]
MVIQYFLDFLCLFSHPVVGGDILPKTEKALYQIIYINGPSSSGKSTLIKQLQHTLKDPYLHVGIDQLINMMPEKVNDWTGGEASHGFSWKAATDIDGKPMQLLQIGPFAKKVSETLKQIVQLMAESGYFIIIDDIAFGKEGVDAWREALRGYQVIYIGIHTPLPVLEERERARGDRMIGSARAQFLSVHRGVSYDLEFDTSKVSVNQIVKSIGQKVYPSVHTQ